MLSHCNPAPSWGALAAWSPCQLAAAAALPPPDGMMLNHGEQSLSAGLAPAA
jgi:hypothetical protein